MSGDLHVNVSVEVDPHGPVSGGRGPVGVCFRAASRARDPVTGTLLVLGILESVSQLLAGNSRSVIHVDVIICESNEISFTAVPGPSDEAKPTVS